MSTTTGTGGPTPAARIIVRTHAGRPAVGVAVLVHDPTGATTQQTTTDATGAALIDLVEGGGVTALYKRVRHDTQVVEAAVSVIGLPGGAEVRLVADPVATPTLPAPMSLAFTGVPPLGPAGWDIVASCDSSTTTSESSLSFVGCQDSSTYDLIAFLSGGAQRLVFAGQPNQPGKSVPFLIDPAKAEAVSTLEVDVQGMPGGTSGLLARLWAYRPEGGRTQVTRLQSPLPPQSTPLQIPRLPVAAGGTFDLEVEALLADGALLARLPFTAAGLPTSPVVWKPVAVPFVSSAGPIMGSASRLEVPWALPPGESPADAVSLTLEYAVGPQPVVRVLYMASSVGATARFPEIPASIPGWVAAPGALVSVSAEHLDIAGTANLLAGVNAEFDRTGAVWSATSFNASLP
jgi:hypothetical protein